MSSEDYGNLSQTDQVIYDGIKNENVDSQIIAENDNITPTGGILRGGAFGGAEYDESTGKVVSKQYVNPFVLGNSESFTGTPKGTGITHEVAENIFIAKESLNHQIDVQIDTLSNPSPIKKDACAKVSAMMPQDNMKIIWRRTYQMDGHSVNFYHEVYTPRGKQGTSNYKELIHFKIPVNDKRLKKSSRYEKNISNTVNFTIFIKL